MGEAGRLAKISNMAQAVLSDPNSSEKDRDQARRIMNGVQFRMGEVSRGAAPGYRGNQSPGMGYGFGPDLPPRRNYGLLV
tara:strand:+ start:138 stop:377 length:240 start_codon:yes stop_codon:yes gene_type:complete